MKHAEGNLQLSVIRPRENPKIGHFRIGLELTTKTTKRSEL